MFILIISECLLPSLTFPAAAPGRRSEVDRRRRHRSEKPTSSGRRPARVGISLDLLAHMTVQHRGFAAAARGFGAILNVWRADSVRDAVRSDPAAPTPRRRGTCSMRLRPTGQPRRHSHCPSSAMARCFPAKSRWASTSWTTSCPRVGRRRLARRPLRIARRRRRTRCCRWRFSVPAGDFRTVDGAPFGPAVEQVRHRRFQPDTAPSRPQTALGSA